MNNIYLVGMMGAGKSVVGKALASQLGCRFIETDTFIVEASGQTIPDLFESKGEEAFRKMESGVLAEIARWDHAVVSSGGGIIMKPENFSLMKSTGKIIYLKTKPETLWKRIASDRTRPLLNVKDPFQRMQDLLRERSPIYEQADITVETDNKKPETIAEEMASLVEQKKKSTEKRS